MKVALTRETYYKRCAVDILQHTELTRLLKIFHEHSVDVLLLKGSFLKNHVYENPALRPMEDIDLLIRKKDSARVLLLLSPLGYKDINAGRFFAEEERGVVELVRQEEHFTYLLDLHTELVNLPGMRSVMNIPVEFVWDDAREISIDGIPCYAMSPEVLLLYLCYHETVHHSLQGATWHSDSREVLRRYADDFSRERFLHFASQFRMNNVAWLALKKTGIEPDAVSSLGRKLTGREKRILERILTRVKNVPFSDYVLALCLIQGTRNKAVFLVSYLSSWMRSGKQREGVLPGARHIVSRFFRLGKAVFVLAFKRARAA